MLEQFFQLPSIAGTINDDRTKILYTLFRMKGEPEVWRNAKLRHYTSGEGDANWPTWITFKTDFTNHWGDCNSAAKVLKVLAKSTYRKGSQKTMRMALADIQAHILEAGINDEEQKKSFLRNTLPKRYQEFLAYARPATYTKAVTALHDYQTELECIPYAFTSTSQQQPVHDQWAMD